MTLHSPSACVSPPSIVGAAGFAHRTEGGRGGAGGVGGGTGKLQCHVDPLIKLGINNIEVFNKPTLLFTATMMLSNRPTRMHDLLNTAETSLADALPASPVPLSSPRLPERTALTDSGVTGLLL